MSADDLVKKFRELRAPSQPSGSGNRNLYSDIEARIAAIQFNNIELPADVEAGLAELDDIFTFNCMNDFPDDHLAGRQAISLRKMSDSDTVNMGRSFLTALTSGVSQYHVGSIFLLAFQLKITGRGGVSTRMFPADDELNQLSDCELGILDKSVSYSRGKAGQYRPVESGSTAELAQAYSFIAAATLRMFTKSAYHYLKSWPHIIDGYSKFYFTRFPITGVTPDLSAVELILGHFSTTEIFKTTLYRFLYNANRNGMIGGLQRYLYDIHLSHTEMHAFPIASRICEALDCSTEVLLEVFYCGRFRRQVDGLRTAFGLMKNTDYNHKRQMWKYGRIFESNFLATLQTKACPLFVYALACVLQRASPESNANILDIKKLEDVSDEYRVKLKEGSKKLIEAINRLKKK